MLTLRNSMVPVEPSDQRSPVTTMTTMTTVSPFPLRENRAHRLQSSLLGRWVFRVSNNPPLRSLLPALHNRPSKRIEGRNHRNHRLPHVETITKNSFRSNRLWTILRECRCGLMIFLFLVLTPKNTMPLRVMAVNLTTIFTDGYRGSSSLRRVNRRPRINLIHLCMDLLVGYYF